MLFHNKNLIFFMNKLLKKAPTIAPLQREKIRIALAAIFKALQYIL